MPDLNRLDGWADMKEFCYLANRSGPTVKKVLNELDPFEKFEWVYYPKGTGDHYSFRRTQMVPFINDIFYKGLKQLRDAN